MTGVRREVIIAPITEKNDKMRKTVSRPYIDCNDFPNKREPMLATPNAEYTTP